MILPHEILSSNRQYGMGIAKKHPAARVIDTIHFVDSGRKPAHPSSRPGGEPWLRRSNIDRSGTRELVISGGLALRVREQTHQRDSGEPGKNRGHSSWPTQQCSVAPQSQQLKRRQDQADDQGTGQPKKANGSNPLGLDQRHEPLRLLRTQAISPQPKVQV